MEEVVNRDIKWRVERHGILKELKGKYASMLKERRETLRKLTENPDIDDGLAREQREKAELLRSHALWSERLELRLEQAEAATLLDRRKEVARPATDAVRKEIAQIEDRLAVAMARQKVLDRELEEMNQSRSSRRELVPRTLDLAEQRNEIAQLEETYLKIATEVEKLNVELAARPRIRTIEDAVPPKTRG
jgi:DNA repair exonuclease SbcCD ATPase subunit